MFFALSKILWALVQPLNALCLMAAAGLALRFWHKKAGQAVANTALILILLFGVLPIGPLLLSWLEHRVPAPERMPDDIDGIILLGGAFESAMSNKTGNITANGQIGRVFCFMELANANPNAVLVASGGAGDILNPAAMESVPTKKFFALSRFDRDVLYEEKSRNTYENAIYSKELVKPEEGQKWAVVTSAYHMPRAIGIFEKIGWRVIPYPCDRKTTYEDALSNTLPNITANFYMLGLAVKELLGNTVYYMTGKTAFLIPPSRVPSKDDQESP
ncbi:MAG: YdcF family protein [Micavibrio aeruginosavorus]|uniref:YdcF family protein n=1 Tax=Micavibrio aeruginosavorus TaxID=349221 RepID=A0A2W5A0X9_9BACT|nr:MAG: YdcF family protein [Micavibrio aeruginosavorus]